nr:glycoside hydrolase family 2 TIM barrel-domain containing protein [Candidatus Sigynarchaeum springense]
MKIEFLPCIINVPFIAIILYVLFDNRSYWGMFNGILAGVFHLGNLPYSEILVWMAIDFGIFTAAYGIPGIIRLRILHVPALNVQPTIMLGVMVILVAVLLNVNVRVNLDYLFFMLGPGPGLAVYVGASLGIFVLVILLVVGVKQLLSLKPDERGLFDGKKLHPRIAATTTLISAGLGFSLILAIGFYYPVTTIYWNNVIGVHTRYVDWSSPAIIILFVLAFASVGTSIFFSLRGKLPERAKKFASREKLLILIALLAASQVAMVTWFSVQFEQSTAPALTGLWIYPATTLALVAGVGFIPLLMALQRCPPGASDIAARVRNMVKSPVLRKLIIVVAACAVVFVPFWFVFYQPLATGPPLVDVPFQARLVQLNGVDVPFVGDTIYPGFETQSNLTREYLNMSGQWRMLRLGVSSVHTLSPRTPYFIEKLTEGQHEVGYDDSGWENTIVPSPVSQYNDTMKTWGVVWYRKTITIPSSFANKTILFKLLGVNYFCDVWIDGTYVGYHEGGFTSFSFDVSTRLDPGPHLFAIRVDNPEWDKKDVFFYSIQPNGADFFNYGGIVRELYLEASPRASISRVDVRQTGFTTTNFMNGSVTADIEVSWKCSGLPGSTGTLNITVYPLVFANETALRSRETLRFANTSAPAFTTSSLVSLVGAAGTNYQALRCSATMSQVAFWSTKRPNLYAVVVNLTTASSSDVFCTQTGFRNFTTSGVELRLNGAPLKLAGVSVHEQYPEPTGRSLTDDQRFADMQCINATRSNWWRGSYPFHPMMYIYSDRFGIACWEESQIFWTNEPDIIDAISRGLTASMWIEMLYRDYNRPSILMWSAGNEPWAYEAFLTYLQRTKAFLDSHDPNRILAFACVSSQDWTRFFRETPLRIVTPNCYGGTFEGIRGDWYNEITANLQRYGNNNPGKPIVNMEWGYWRGDSHFNQSTCFLDGFRAFTENPRVQGFTWWLLHDYYGPDYYNGMGVYNMERTWYEPNTFSAMVANYTTFTSSNL